MLGLKFNPGTVFHCLPAYRTDLLLCNLFTINGHSTDLRRETVWQAICNMGICPSGNTNRILKRKVKEPGMSIQKKSLISPLKTTKKAHAAKEERSQATTNTPQLPSPFHNPH